MKNRSDGSKIADRARELYTSSRKVAAEEIDRAHGFIHANPVKSALVGVGLGFLLASLFRSRDE
ncbi:MAG TPA: hypothetical protein VKU80_09590 [Planctomycetota bacterium]|nr:hypothetical protein [Planctomycetota bacterium]